MSLSSLLTSSGIGAVGGGVIIACVEGIFGRGGKRAEAAARLVEAESQKHERWFREATESYERLEDECNKCIGRLRRLGTAFYGLLDDLNDLDETDARAQKSQVRAAVRKARAAADWGSPQQDPP